MKSFILTLLMCGVCYAGLDTMDGGSITTSTSFDGSTVNIASADGASITSGGASYLFEAGFETDGMISWDYTYGAEDCDGYDASGDWCDYDTTQYHGGTHSLGCYALSNSIVTKNLSGSSTEFYIDAWIRFDALTANVYSFKITHSDTTSDMSLLFLTSGIVYVSHADGATQSASSTVVANTWYHIGIYMKQETTPGSSGDGIVRAYLRTDATAFSYSDVILEDTTVATGTVDADVLVFRGAGAGETHWYDDVIFDAGDPGWPTS